MPSQTRLLSFSLLEEDGGLEYQLLLLKSLLNIITSTDGFVVEGCASFGAHRVAGEMAALHLLGLQSCSSTSGSSRCRDPEPKQQWFSTVARTVVVQTFLTGLDLFYAGVKLTRLLTHLKITAYLPLLLININYFSFSD